MAGALFETHVIAVVLKSWTGHGRRPPIYYWRTKDKAEIDLLFEIDGVIYPAEIKLSASPQKPGAAWARLRASGLSVGRGSVICLCEQTVPLSEDVDAVPVGMM